MKAGARESLEPMVARRPIATVRCDEPSAPARPAAVLPGPPCRETSKVRDSGAARLPPASCGHTGLAPCREGEVAATSAVLLRAWCVQASGRRARVAATASTASCTTLHVSQ